MIYLTPVVHIVVSCLYWSYTLCYFVFYYSLVCRCFFFFFFFQAEDGIRDWSVTGVQTCALPILCRFLASRTPYPRDSRHEVAETSGLHRSRQDPERRADAPLLVLVPSGQESLRSEERRVGKERRAGEAREQ